MVLKIKFKKWISYNLKAFIVEAFIESLYVGTFDCIHKKAYLLLM